MQPRVYELSEGCVVLMLWDSLGGWFFRSIIVSLERAGT